MRAADERSTNALYVSTDSPERFDDKYPNHIRDVFVERASDDKRIVVAFSIEREVGDDDTDIAGELRELLAPLVARYGGSNFDARRAEEYEEPFVVRFEIPTRGQTVRDALAIGDEALALIQATEGGPLTLQTTVDLIRAGNGAVLIGQREGPWFDGKAAPYVLASEDKKWELAKDVAAFANSETGGIIFIGAKTKRGHDGDVVSAVGDFDLSLVKPPQYRGVLAAKVRPRVEELEIRTVSTQGSRGMAYIYVPSQRAVLKPFVVKGVVVEGSLRATHVCIPERDGEDTRFADPSEVHSLLQAGRVALRQA